jgi:hypothetical protein
MSELWLARFSHEMTSCNANISSALDKRIHGYLPYAKTAFVTATNAWQKSVGAVALTIIRLVEGVQSVHGDYVKFGRIALVDDLNVVLQHAKVGF